MPRRSMMPSRYCSFIFIVSWCIFLISHLSNRKQKPFHITFHAIFPGSWNQREMSDWSPGLQKQPADTWHGSSLQGWWAIVLLIWSYMYINDMTRLFRNCFTDFRPGLIKRSSSSFSTGSAFCAGTTRCDNASVATTFMWMLHACSFRAHAPFARGGFCLAF